jgi:acyl-CoA synthetase (AMP-forming)/AMP-acid ligase II
MAPNYDITAYGKRLLPHIVDERARSGYQRPFALYPHSKVLGEGFRAVSYAQLANAVNRAAWWLEAKITRDEEKEKPVAYLGPNDLRYIIFLLATMKTGRKVNYELCTRLGSENTERNADFVPFPEKHCRCAALTLRKARL